MWTDRPRIELPARLIGRCSTFSRGAHKSGTTACWPMAVARPTWHWRVSPCRSSQCKLPRPATLSKPAGCPSRRQRPSSAGTAATRWSSCRPSHAVRPSAHRHHHDQPAPQPLARQPDEHELVGPAGSRVPPRTAPHRPATLSDMRLNGDVPGAVHTQRHTGTTRMPAAIWHATAQIPIASVPRTPAVAFAAVSSLEVCATPALRTWQFVAQCCAPGRCPTTLNSSRCPRLTAFGVLAAGSRSRCQRLQSHD
jgi:hypothetical protein